MAKSRLCSRENSGPAVSATSCRLLSSPAEKTQACFAHTHMHVHTNTRTHTSAHTHARTHTHTFRLGFLETPNQKGVVYDRTRIWRVSDRQAEKTKVCFAFMHSCTHARMHANAHKFPFCLFHLQ